MDRNDDAYARDRTPADMTGVSSVLQRIASDGRFRYFLLALTGQRPLPRGTPAHVLPPPILPPPAEYACPADWASVIRKLTCDSAFRLFLTDFSATSGDRARGLLSLTDLVQALELAGRQWDVLNARLGIGVRLTLDEAGEKVGGVTRERIRQIQRAASRKVSKCLRRHVPLLLALDALLRAVRRDCGHNGLANRTVSDVTATMRSSGWEVSDADEVACLVIALRAAVDLGEEPFERFLPNLTFYACSLAPPVTAHTLTREWYRAKQKADHEHARRKTYPELAQAVLQEEGQPLHYREVARRIEDLRSPRPTSLPGVHNALNSLKDTFALVAPGTFGLTAWGIKGVDTYPDIIAHVLKQHGRTLARGEILHCVSGHRSVKPITLYLLLDTHPRFYRSVEGLYGLRAWLPERERQTLRTPKHLVEDAESWARIARACERGYDVVRLVAADKPE